MHFVGKGCQIDPIGVACIGDCVEDSDRTAYTEHFVPDHKPYRGRHQVDHQCAPLPHLLSGASAAACRSSVLMTMIVSPLGSAERRPPACVEPVPAFRLRVASPGQPEIRAGSS